MKDDWLSSATRITDERAAAALSDPMLRRLVLSFVQVPRSIGEIAAESQIDIKRLHHHVTRLCQIGLLKVVGKRRRPGRAIKLYGASAEAFFIPFEVAPELFTEGLSRELRERIRAENLTSGNGVLLATDEQGLAIMRFVAEEKVPGSAAELWRVLRLEAAEAEALMREVNAVFDRHAVHASGRGKPYLVHAALAPRLAPTVSVDNQPRGKRG